MGVIYKISNNIDNRIYIGSTINTNKRWYEHRRNLLNNKHQNIHLQRFVNKYGINSLSFEIIENIVDNKILIREQYYLDTIDNKFNIANNATAPMLGKSHTKEALNKISKRSSGSNNPMFGKKRPQWLINKLIESNIRRNKTSDEKILRLINLSNRKEIKLIKEGELIYCFSISHAAKIVGVTQQSISKSLKNKTKSKNWDVIISNDNFYKKTILLKNIQLFDNYCHPQPELIQMLKSLK